MKIFLSTKSNTVFEKSLIRKGPPVFGQGISFLRPKTDCDRRSFPLSRCARVQRGHGCPKKCIYMYVKHILVSYNYNIKDCEPFYMLKKLIYSKLELTRESI